MKEEDTGRNIEKLFKYWPLIVVIFSAIAGYLKLSFYVDQVREQQERWQQSAESRRQKTYDDLETVRTRLTRLEGWRDCIESRKCK